MTRSLLAAAATLLLATTAHASSATPTPTTPAKPVTLADAGNWMTLFTARNTSGVPMCVMKAKTPAVAPGGWAYVKYVNDRVYITFLKYSWKIPSNTQVPASVQIDGDPPHPGKANAVLSADYTELFFPVGDDKLNEFYGAFAAGSQLKVSFPEGNEPSWTVDLNGTREAMTAFQKCIVDVPANTSPLGKDGSTLKDAPTQPFKPKGNSI